MIREVCKLRPVLPVLFMPGYGEEQLRDQIGIARRAIPARAVFGAADFGQGGGGAGGVVLLPA